LPALGGAADLAQHPAKTSPRPTGVSQTLPKRAATLRWCSSRASTSRGRATGEPGPGVAGQSCPDAAWRAL